MTDWKEPNSWGRILGQILAAVVLSVAAIGAALGASFLTWWSLLQLGWVKDNSLLAGTVAVTWLWFMGAAILTRFWKSRGGP